MSDNNDVSKQSTKTRRRTPITPTKTAMDKTTDLTPGGGTSRRRTVMSAASASVIRTQPKVYAPQYLDSNLNFPRDMRTQNAWNRNYYVTNPIVRTAINMHAAYTTSKFQIECEDPKIQEFFENMLQKMDFSSLLHEIALEFWKLGEAFPYLELDPDNGVWEYGLVHNPDFIRVVTNAVSKDPIITLVPDEALRKLVTSTDPRDRAMRESIPLEVMMHIQKGEDIPLENFNISHIKLLSSPYDPRGTSIITSCYRDLMLFDKIREAKFIQADNFINPITLIKLGDPNGNWKPTDDDIRQWQEQVLDSVGDQGYQLVTHGMVNVEKITNSGQVLDMNPDVEECKKNILFGLMVPAALFDQDYGSYANATVALETLKMRYEAFRMQIKKWVEKKVFEPISKIQDFYEVKNGEQQLIVPRVKWGKLLLRETDTYINALAGQVGQEGNPGKVSIRTFLESLDIDYHAEQKRLRQEMIDGIVFKKELQALQHMQIEQLKTLGPDTPILDTRDLDTIEKTLDMNAGSSPDEGAGSADSGDMDLGGGLDLGTPDLDLGSPPPSAPPEAPPPTEPSPPSGSAPGEPPP